MILVYEKPAYATLERMKVYVLYRPNSEYSRQVEEYVYEFRRREHGRRVELVDLDTREGAAMASLYDVVRYPAILATADDGRALKVWQGTEEVPPTMNDLAYYARA